MSTLIGWLNEFSAQTPQYCLSIAGAVLLIGLTYLIASKRR